MVTGRFDSSLSANNIKMKRSLNWKYKRKHQPLNKEFKDAIADRTPEEKDAQLKRLLNKYK